MAKIKIGRKNYNLKYSIRSLFLFEQITHKAFKIETLLDNYIFFYCLLLSSNKDNPIDWDDFIDELDKDPQLYKRIADVVEEEQKKSDLTRSDEDEKDGDEKKS